MNSLSYRSAHPRWAAFLLTWALAALAGCATTDIPQAYRGMEFRRTGLLALYSGGKGFVPEVLNPGSYFTGIYNSLFMVDCSMSTVREPLTALTKDGVQFGIDIYIRYSVDCSDDAVRGVLTQVTPDQGDAITSGKMYATFVRPAVASAVREVVSPLKANELNDRREELLDGIRKKVLALLDGREHRYVKVHEVNLSNLDFPDAMDAANVDRAVQSVLRDKAVAARERVTAEIETMRLRQTLAEKESDSEAAKIDRIGAALRRNPEFLQYDLQQKMPEIYRTAGAQGNMVIAAPEPHITMPSVRGRRSGAEPAREPAIETPDDAARQGHGPPASRPNPVQGHDDRRAPRDP